MEAALLEEHNKRDKSHLIRLISRRSSGTPNFALLLGAGASFSSGVKTAGQMIEEWRKQLYLQSASKVPLEEWVKLQDWYEDDEEYSILFEKVCDQRSQRRIYVEDCVKDAKPSWGYIYLANLIANACMNVIFTPNFDDLINEACFVYTDLKPIVCAHDSAVSDIRITSARPKIIKLHGDFLYDSIKNTVKETETLEKNMRDKFLQFAREYGLVVIGYGGNDRSVMDILDTMLRSNEFLPNGLYWCIQEGSKVSKKLDRLMQRENAYWVEIENFDCFMAELHENLGLKLPDSVRNPYQAATKKLNGFILPKDEIKHPIILEDISELEGQIKLFEQMISGSRDSKDFDKLVPYRFLGDNEFARRNYDNALIYYRKALLQKPDDIEVMGNMFYCYRNKGEFKDALKTAEQIIASYPNDFLGYWCKGTSLVGLNKIKDGLTSFQEALTYTSDNKPNQATVLISLSNNYLLNSQWSEGLSAAEKAIKLSTEVAAVLNKCIALKNLGRYDEAREIINSLLPKIKSKYAKACAFALLGDKANMLTELEQAIKENPSKKVDARKDPDFADYWQDDDFNKLL